MRAFRECVFNDTIMGETTVYTATQFNRLLASAPNLIIQANSFNVAASDDKGELSVQIQVSSDGRNWIDKYDNAEINQVQTSKNAVNVDIGYDDGSEPSMPFVRLKITTSGNATRTGLKVWVAGRGVIPCSARRARQAAAVKAAPQAPAQRTSKSGGCGEACGCGRTSDGAMRGRAGAVRQATVRALGMPLGGDTATAAAPGSGQRSVVGPDPKVVASAVIPRYQLASCDDLNEACTDYCEATGGAEACFLCCLVHDLNCKNIPHSYDYDTNVCRGFFGWIEGVGHRDPFHAEKCRLFEYECQRRCIAGLGKWHAELVPDCLTCCANSKYLCDIDDGGWVPPQGDCQHSPCSKAARQWAYDANLRCVVAASGNPLMDLHECLEQVRRAYWPRVNACKLGISHDFPSVWIPPFEGI